MAGAFNIIARDSLEVKSAREIPWAQLRYGHKQQATGRSEAIATSLPGPTGALSGRQGRPREAWRLRKLEGEEMEKSGI